MIRSILNNRPGKALLVLLFSLVAALPARSQDMEVGLFGGCSYYLGDLNPGVHFQQPNLAFGALARLNIDERWAVKLSGYYGKVQGSSATSTYLPDRGLAFTSPVTDLSAVAEFNFLPYFTGSRRNAASPFIYAGVGVFMMNPSSGGVDLQPLGTEGQNIGFEGRKPYKLVQFDIPFGVGGKFSLSKKLGMTVFWEIHKTFTDYIDDVSTTYYLDGPEINPNDVAAIHSDPTQSFEPGMQRGNSKNKDWYSFSGITITYKFALRSHKRCRDLREK